MSRQAVPSQGTVFLYRATDPFRLESSLERAFERHGWDVRPFHCNSDGQDLSWWLRSRIARRATRGSLALRRAGARERNRGVLRRAEKLEPDVALVVKGQFLMPETVAALKRRCGAVAVLHPDTPFPGNPNARPEHLPAALEADICFIWSRKLQKRLEKAGARRAVYLPFGWDPEVFPHVGEPDPDGPEVVFVGGWDRWRERWLEPVAERFDLAVWGPEEWGTRTRRSGAVRTCWRRRALRGREAAEAVAGADIALNLLRKQNLPDGTNMRTFEVPGAGGFLLAMRTDGAREIYPEGEAGAYFGSVDELLEKIEHYLAHPAERRGIARRAHEITRRDHRYVDRVERILASLGRLVR